MLIISDKYKDAAGKWRATIIADGQEHIFLKFHTEPTDADILGEAARVYNRILADKSEIQLIEEQNRKEMETKVIQETEKQIKLSLIQDISIEELIKKLV